MGEKEYFVKHKRGWLAKKLFVPPFYAKYEDTMPTSGIHYAIRILGSLVMLKLGYEAANFEIKDSNEKIKNSKVVEYETEEQIFDYLYN